MCLEPNNTIIQMGVDALVAYSNLMCNREKNALNHSYLQLKLVLILHSSQPSIVLRLKFGLFTIQHVTMSGISNYNIRNNSKSGRYPLYFSCTSVWMRIEVIRSPHSRQQTGLLLALWTVYHLTMFHPGNLYVYLDRICRLTTLCTGYFIIIVRR